MTAWRHFELGALPVRAYSLLSWALGRVCDAESHTLVLKRFHPLCVHPSMPMRCDRVDSRECGAPFLWGTSYPLPCSDFYALHIFVALIDDGLLALEARLTHAYAQ